MQKKKKTKQNTGTSGTLFWRGGWWAAERKRAGSMGPATAALRPCRKLAKRQGGEERKGRKEEAFLSLSLSLSLSLLLSREIYLLLFSLFCFVDQV